MEKARNQIIDFFRGIVICDMILVHFNGYFPALAAKFLSYTDIAMEGFVFLAGFGVGQHYYGKYIQDKGGVRKRLLFRTLEILSVQYVLILTINLPLYYFVYEKIRQTESIYVFLLKSMLFLNQIGLLHILPTFIPLFLVSPVILYLFSRKLDWIVILTSIVLFTFGVKYPHLLDAGENAIFPVILWQIYFVAGCLLGKQAYLRGRIAPENIDKYFVASILVCLLAMFIKHGKVISPFLTEKFPLNALGLLYGSSLLFLIYTFTMKYWEVLLGKIKLFNHYLPVLGRHSLLAFIIHVYTAKIILVVNYFYQINPYLNYCLILLSLALIYKSIELYEIRRKQMHQYIVLNRVP